MQIFSQARHPTKTPEINGTETPHTQHRLPHGEVGAEQALSPGDHVSKVDQAERLLAGLIGRHHLLRAGDQAGQVQLSIGQRAGMAGQHSFLATS